MIFGSITKGDGDGGLFVTFFSLHRTFFALIMI